MIGTSALRCIRRSRIDRPFSSSSLTANAVVHRIGDEYNSREYLLMPAGYAVEEDRNEAFASLRSHRNIVFGARLLIRPEQHQEEQQFSEWTLPNVCGPLVERQQDRLREIDK